MTTDPWKHIHTSNGDPEFAETTLAMNTPDGCVLRVVASDYKLKAMTECIVLLPNTAVAKDGDNHVLVSHNWSQADASWSD